jgi:hypothetical protein
VKHTNEKKCYLCKTVKDISYYHKDKSQKDGLQSRCKECRKDTKYEGHADRMFVNGKYITRSHPLYKPGNYKTFEDAAFQSLSRYSSSKEGQVYIIINPAWKGWIKVGMAIDAEDRCKGYQTSSPLRDFKLKFKKYFEDRRTAEQTAHSLCAKKASKRKGEWFKLNVNDAKDIINNMEIN